MMLSPRICRANCRQQAAKRTKVLEEALKREKVRILALFGVAATLSVA